MSFRFTFRQSHKRDSWFANRRLPLAVLLALFWAGLAPAVVSAQTTLEVRVSNGFDDAVEDSSDGDVTRNGNDIELVDSSNSDTAGLRFQNISVPAGSTITNAYIQFQADETDSGDVSLTIRGEASDNASQFSNGKYNITSRPSTSASVAWSPPAWSSIGEASANERTPDISSVIQEIVDRAGWSSGNSLAIIVKGSGTRVAESYEGSSSGAALLHIEYGSTPSGATTFYVRPDGNDSNSGEGPTAGEAWGTLGAAFTKGDLTAGATVYVMTGTYTQSIDPSQDGASGNPIRVIADTNGTVAGWPAGPVVLQAAAGGHALQFHNDDYWRLEGFTLVGVGGQDAVRIRNTAGVELIGCEISGGSVGVHADNAAAVTLINGRIHDNTSIGVHVDHNDANVTIWNSTIAHNGDGVRVNSGAAVLKNSIVAFNTDDGLELLGGSLSHSYNLVFGAGDSNYSGLSAAGSEITLDPQFTDAAARDYHLGPTSPALDTGTGAAGIVDDDIEGIARPLGSGWDMGCHEFSILAHWQFAEGSGVDAADSSGNAHDGTLQGGVGWTTVRCSSAVSFLGAGDWIDFGALTLNDEAYSVACWFQTSNEVDQTIFAATPAGESGQQILIGLDAQGHVGFVHRSPPAESGGIALQSADAYNDGTFHHVAAVKSATDLRLYVDGEIVDMVSTAASLQTAVDVVLGRAGLYYPQDYFSGVLDDVQVYGSALSDSQVGALVGLVGRWKLDESSGSTAADSTVYDNSGALGSGFTFDASGVANAKVSGGLRFDGSGDNISVPDSTVLQITSALTIAGWVKGDGWGSGTDVDVIACKGENDPNNYQLAIADGRAALFLDDSDSGGYRGDTLLSTGVWYHIAATWDGAEVRIYVNGVLDHSAPFARTGVIGTDARPLYIGGRGETDYFDGVLDEVRLYNRALCADEIAQLQSGDQPAGVRIIRWIEIQ